MTKASTQEYLASSVCRWVSNRCFLASNVSARSSHSALYPAYVRLELHAPAKVRSSMSTVKRHPGSPNLCDSSQ